MPNIITDAIVVPAEIFNIVPEIEDMRSFPYPGAIFSTAQYIDRFSIFITFELNPVSYYADQPLSINKTDLSADTISQLDLTEFGFDGKVSDLANIEAIKQLTGTNVLNEMQNSVNIMDNLEELKANPLNQVSCPELTTEEQLELEEANLMTTEIRDTEGNVIETIQTQLSEQPFSCPNSTDPAAELTANILNGLVIPSADNPLDTSTEPAVCHIPEGPYQDIVKDALTTAEVQTNVTTLDVNNITNSLTAVVDRQLELIGNNTAIDPDTAEENVEVIKDMLDDVELVQYGIPVLVINKELNIIIQIVNGELRVLNFDKFITDIPGLEIPNTPSGFKPNISTLNPELKIDIVENPGARILPGIKYTLMYSRRFNNHKIELQREFKDEVYQAEAVAGIDTGMFYLGTDKAGLKHFCGKFHDVHLTLDGSDSVRNYNRQNSFMNEIYGALAFYDFYNPGDSISNQALSRIKFNKVYPYKNITNAISMRGDWKLEDRLTNNYTFMNHGFIDDIFCKDFFLKKSFTISVWINKNRRLDNPEDFRYKKRQMIISDNINENYFWYDESTYEFNIQFHGFHYRMFFNIIPQLWNMVTFRYSAELQKFYLDVKIKTKDIDGIYTTETFSEEFQLDTDLEVANKKEFRLLNIFAEYIWDKKEHQNIFDCLSGPIILYDNFQTDLIINNNFENQWPVLDEYLLSGIS